MVQTTDILLPNQLLLLAFVPVPEQYALVFSSVDPADVGDGEGAVRGVHREARLVHDVEAHPGVEAEVVHVGEGLVGDVSARANDLTVGTDPQHGRRVPV